MSMDNLVFTQLSVSEIRQLFRQELEGFFTDHSLTPSQTEADHIGGIELALEITGLAKPTIYGLVSQSKIPHSKRGKKLYFSRQELIEWIREGKRKTVADIDRDANSYISNRKRKG